MIEISVIVPVYNSQKYLSGCIESVLNQTYKNFELILVDDGSTDDSGNICNTYVLKDERVVVIHKENGGVSAARNTGIEIANGKRILFLDSDDQLDSKTLNLCMEYVDEADFDVICWSLKTNDKKKSSFANMSTNLTIAYENDEQTLYDIRVRGFTGFSKENIKDSCMHFAVTKLIKKSILIDNNVRFDEQLKYHEDTIFTAFVLEHAKSIVAVNQPLYLRTIHNESATQSFCPTINEINKRSNNIFTTYVEKYYKNDERFVTALYKYKLAWFLQSIKLDVMNPSANYSSKERFIRLKELLRNEWYYKDIHIKSRKFNFKLILFYYLVKYKAAYIIYICAKLKLI